jgi:hypothetical protein
VSSSLPRRHPFRQRDDANVTLDPWTAAMLRGDFAAAWRISDQVLAQRLTLATNCFAWPRHLQFVWRGESLEGKRVLVRCYHGLGDTIQFARLLAPLRGVASQVTLWLQPSLLAVLASLKGIDQLLPLHDGTPDVDRDAEIEIMELAHFFRLTADTIPAEVPYICLSPDRRVGLDPRKLHVGIAWQSGEWDTARSIPDGLLSRLSALPHIQWHSLQYGAKHCTIEQVQSMACKEIDAMARGMMNLDLVISVDTMVAHLAGAMGLPVWVLLQHECDWRWMSQGDRTPWYPTMHLIRQPRIGDWAPVLEEVRARLLSRAELIQGRGIRSAGCRAS